MKAYKPLLCAMSLAAFLCGCGDNGEGDAIAADALAEAVPPTPAAYDAPLVAEGAALAIALDQGEIQGLVDSLLGAEKDALVAEAKDEMPAEVRDFISSAGLEGVKTGWAVATFAEPTLDGSGLPSEVPESSLAVAFAHDIDRLIGAVRKAVADSRVEVVETVIGGERAWTFAGGDVVPGQPEASVSSLAGKLLLVSSSPAALEKQIRLYRDGKGASAAFEGFALGKGGMARLSVCDIGPRIKRMSGAGVLPILQTASQFIPNGDKMLARLGNMDFSAGRAEEGGLELFLTLGTGSDGDADMIATLAKTALLPLQAQAMKEAGRDPSAKIAMEMLNKLKISARGAKVSATLRIPAEVARAIAAEVRDEARSARARATAPLRATGGRQN